MPYLPVNEKLYTNLDPEARSEYLAAAYDVIKDDAMGNVRRPGLSLYKDLGANPVDSLYNWLYNDKLAAVSGGAIYDITSGAQQVTGATLNAGVPVSFADFGSSLFLANGGQIIKWDGGNTCAYISNSNAPSAVTHIGFIDQYLVALSDGIVYWSSVGDPTTWEGEFATPELQPDRPNALHIGWDEITIFGERTIEYWYNAGDAGVFRRVSGSNTERGTLSPYSIAEVDQTYFFLDNERKVVRLQGRQPQIISTPIDRELQNLTTITDARGFHINNEGFTLYVITFPTEGRTWAYDYKRDAWFEWSFFNSVEARRDGFLGQASVYDHNTGKCYTGSRLYDGKIYEVTGGQHTDEDEKIVSDLWTGWMFYGTGEWKSPRELRLKLKRGYGEAFQGKTLEVYYRDNGSTIWKGPRHVDLGQLGDTGQEVVRLRRWKRYRTRQYRFRCSEDVPVNIISVEEVF